MLVYARQHLREEGAAFFFNLMLFLSYFFRFVIEFRVFLFTFVPVNQ